MGPLEKVADLSARTAHHARDLGVGHLVEVVVDEDRGEGFGQGAQRFLDEYGVLRGALVCFRWSPPLVQQPFAVLAVSNPIEAEVSGRPVEPGKLVDRTVDALGFFDEFPKQLLKPRAAITVDWPGLEQSSHVIEGALEYTPAGAVSSLEVLLDRRSDGTGATVVVYGRLGSGVRDRVMGIDPVVTVDGSVSQVQQHDALPWVVFVKTGSGMLEVQWRGFSEVIDL